MRIRTRTTPTAALLVVAALSALTACSSGGGPVATGGDGSTPTAIPPTATVAKGASVSGDVTLDSCAIDTATKIPEAALTVTNHGSDTATYTIRVEFVDGGGTRLAEGAAIANSVAANQQAKETAGGSAQVSSDVTCKITGVKRLAGM